MKEKQKTLKEYFFSNFTIIFLSMGAVVAIMFFALLKTYIGFSEKQISGYAENVVSQYADDMKTEFENSEKLWMNNNMYVGGDMTIYMTSSEQHNVSASIEALDDMMNNHMSSCRYLDSIYLYARKNNYVIASRSNTSNSGYLNMFADNTIIKSSVLSTEESIVKRKIGDKIYISSCIPVTIKDEVIGSMIFNYNFDILEKEKYEGTSGMLYVTLNDNVVYSTNSDNEYNDISELIKHDKDYRKAEIYNFGNDRLELWYFGYMEEHKLFDGIIITVCLVMIGILFLMMTLLSVHTTKRYYNSVIDIITKLTKESATFSELNRKDIRNINGGAAVAVKNDVSFEDIIAEKLLALRKYEAVALQSQLNSHFLFNTLNLLSIIDLKQNKRSTEISRIVKNMSAILKYSMDLKNMLVTVGDEAAYCDTYVEIQKIKYKDKINFTKEIDEALENVKIPKFILQPIVENAIFHGMDKKADVEQIKITVTEKNGILCISVLNTGKTIEAETLKRLQEHIDKSEVKSGKHIGLSNINARIKLLYGDEYGVFIASENGETNVRIYMPI